MAFSWFCTTHKRDNKRRGQIYKEWSKILQPRLARSGYHDSKTSLHLLSPQFFLFATVSNPQQHPHRLFFFCPTFALSVELSALVLRTIATLDAVEQAGTLLGALVDVPYDALSLRNLEE